MLLVIVTMLNDKTAAIMRSDEGLGMDNCLLWHIARMLAYMSNTCARFMWAPSRRRGKWGSVRFCAVRGCAADCKPLSLHS